MENAVTMQKLDVTSLKQLATAGAKIGTATGKILADGKVDFTDVVHLPAVLNGIKDLSGVDYKALLPELKDLDDTERAELSAHFSATFDIPNDSVEVVVEQGLDICLMVLQAILSFVRVGEVTKTAA